MEETERLGIELACQRLAFQFCSLNDHRRYREYSELFTEDGEFARPGLEVRGRGAIRDALSQRPAHLETRHLCTNVIIDVTGRDRATGTGTQLYFAHDTTAKATQTPLVIDFVDTYVRTPDGWRIATRRVTPAF